MCPQQMGSLPPLTPITPSVEPGQGSKTGFAVPHTPNTMTNSQFQFSNCVQVNRKYMEIENIIEDRSLILDLLFSKFLRGKNNTSIFMSS